MVGFFLDHSPNCLNAFQPRVWRAASIVFLLGIAACAREDYGAIQEEAERGNAIAQDTLGTMYAEGRGVAEDDAEAVRWWRLASEQGLADAQFNLGLSYQDGRGVDRNDAEAVRLYRLAAEQGLADAQGGLGFMYYEGRGVEQDDAEALRWFRLAARQGHAATQGNLGAMYMEGRGVEQDDAEAVRLYRLGAEQGDADAQFGLGQLYAGGGEMVNIRFGPDGVSVQKHSKDRGVDRDDGEAARWYRLAAEQGHAAAQAGLGFMIYNGRGVAEKPHRRNPMVAFGRRTGRPRRESHAEDAGHGRNQVNIANKRSRRGKSIKSAGRRRRPPCVSTHGAFKDSRRPLERRVASLGGCPRTRSRAALFRVNTHGSSRWLRKPSILEPPRPNRTIYCVVFDPFPPVGGYFMGIISQSHNFLP